MSNKLSKNMNFHKIKDRYLRIRPGTDISINTPIINLNIGMAFLVRTDAREPIYDVNIDTVLVDLKKNHHLEFESIDHVDDYISVGQVDRRYYGPEYDGGKESLNPSLSIIIVNKRVVPTTKSYRQLRNNIWLAETMMGGTKMRSLGTIYSKEKPTYSTPIFPVAMMKKVSRFEPNYNVYSDHSYGRRVLNDTALNIDKRNRRMINSTGDISLIQNNVFIPMTPEQLHGADMAGIDEKYNRKVYFTTQGSITNDSACIKPSNNRMKNNLMECNGIATQTNNRSKGKPNSEHNVEPTSSGDLDMNAMVTNNNSNNKEYTFKEFNNMSLESHMINYDNTNYKILNDREKQIIMREKDEPWFINPEIVGDIAIYDNPHTVTGHHNTLEMTDYEIYNTIEELKPKGSLGALRGDTESLVLIGTFDGDTDEKNMPFTTDCKIDPVIGYSRYDKLQKCLNRDDRNRIGKMLENFETEEDEQPNYNNQIMVIMFVVILFLLFYKFRI